MGRKDTNIRWFKVLAVVITFVFSLNVYVSYRTRHVKSPARRGRVVHHEISSHPAVLFSQQHQHVTKDGDLLSAHGYTHFSASCYLVRNANCTNKLTVRLGTFIFFPLEAHPTQRQPSSCRSLWRHCSSRRFK